MTPIRSLPGKPGGPAVLPWIGGAALVATLFAGPRLLHNTAPAAIPAASVAEIPATPAVPLAPPAAAMAKLPHGTVSEYHSIDAANVANDSTDLAHGASDISAPRGSVVSISGWAVDRTAHAPSYAVFAAVDGHIFPARIGVRRDDVAVALASPAYATSGFRIDLDTAALPIGRSAVTLYGVAAGGRTSYDLHRNLTLTLTPSSGSYPH